ncbi:MAG: 4Fe-4S binding protein [Candidatus Heimdallarchaeota archaeon]|nr:4Fe-4S binding protein [Candidatus Heimdallarchaeota archaeon]
MPRPGVIIWEALRNAFKKKKATIDYPFQEGVKPKKGLRGAHYFILEKCTGCRACERACPPMCIEMVPSEVTKTGKRPVINLGECIFCGLCEEACRYDALFLTDYIELSAFGRDEMIIYSKETKPSESKEQQEEG